MSAKYLDLLTRVARQPRHAASGEAAPRVRIQRPQADEGTSCDASLLNFSRGGCRVRCRENFREGEAVLVRLGDPARGLELSLPGTIRWCRDEDEKGFAAGCQFDDEVNYEQLGELFLAGFLATDVPDDAHE
jgi:hypothetical protein